MGAIVIVIVISDALEHMTVTGGIVVVAVICNTMRNTLQIKKNYYINFLWPKIRIHLERVIVNTP